MSRDAASASDDEEEDCISLVTQNDTKHLHHRSSLEISNSASAVADVERSRAGLSSRVCMRKRYLFALLVPVLLLVLFFSLDLGEVLRDGVGFSVVVSRGPALATSSEDAKRMREAELRVLYLLRDQQQELLKLWSRMLSAGVPVSPSPTAALVPSDEFKSALLRQIM